MEKINFKDAPSTETPLSAFTLNKMQENIEESAVVVSSTEPTTNEKVWLKKGKNLINPSRLKYGYNFSDEGKLEALATYFVTDYIEIVPNTAYCSSGFKTSSGADNITKLYFDENYNLVIRKDENPTIAPSDAKYLCLEGHIENSSNMQLEEGNVATSYEEYIEPAIFVKNSNGVFEELISKKSNEMNIITGEEFATNEYIDGRKVYGKRIVLENCNGQGEYSLGIDITQFEEHWIDLSNSYIKIESDPCPIPFYFNNDYKIGVSLMNNNLKTSDTVYNDFTIVLVLKYIKKSA